MVTQRIITLFLTLFLVTSLSAKTRWSTNRMIPDADFLGSGEFTIGYEAFLNTETANEINAVHLIPFTIGIGEWLSLSTGWADGVSLEFKGRILDEYKANLPSMAIGVRNLYNNTMLARGGVENDAPDVTGELYLAISKGFDLITTRFHGGFTSIPHSTTEQFNAFFGIEKYFGGDFYVTFEGWTFMDRLNLSLFGTYRFLPENRAEVYVGMVDLERLLFDQYDELGMSLLPDSEDDPIKPGISLGVTFNFSAPFGSRTQFRTMEDLYEEQQEQIAHILASQDSLRGAIEAEQIRNDILQHNVDSLSELCLPSDTLPRYFQEIYARLLLYRKGHESSPFDPEFVRETRLEIFAFGEHAEQSLLRVLIRGDQNFDIEMDAVALLGMMGSKNAVPILLERLGTEMDRRMKIEIITALGSIGDRGATYALEQLAQSADKAVAATATEVLTQWGGSVDSSPQEMMESSGEFIIE